MKKQEKAEVFNALKNRVDKSEDLQVGCSYAFVNVWHEKGDKFRADKVGEFTVLSKRPDDGIEIGDIRGQGSISMDAKEAIRLNFYAKDDNGHSFLANDPIDWINWERRATNMSCRPFRYVVKINDKRYGNRKAQNEEVSCDQCRGSGYIEKSGKPKGCSNCGGSGKIEHYDNMDEYSIAPSFVETCKRCKGGGNGQNDLVCERCNGVGKFLKSPKWIKCPKCSSNREVNTKRSFRCKTCNDLGKILTYLKTSIHEEESLAAKNETMTKKGPPPPIILPKIINQESLAISAV